MRLRKQDLEWRKVEGEIIALDVRTSKYLAINKTGTVLWPLLIDGCDMQTLIATLRKTFDIDEATANEDLSAFIESLEERGLIEQ